MSIILTEKSKNLYDIKDLISINEKVPQELLDKVNEDFTLSAPITTSNIDEALRIVLLKEKLARLEANFR